MLDSKTVINGITFVLTTYLFSCFPTFEDSFSSWYLLIGVCTLVFAIKTRGMIELKFEPYYVFNMLMIIYTFTSSICAWAPYFALKIACSMAVRFICFSLLYIAFSKDNSVLPFISICKWAGYIVMIRQYMHYGISQLVNMLLSAERATNEVGNVNVIGMTIAFSCIFELLEIIRKKKITLSSIMLAPAFLIISATQSRKALLVLIIGIILIACFYFIDKEHIIKSIFRLGIFAVGLFLIYLLFKASPAFSGLAGRMELLFNLLRDEGEIGGSSLARMKMISIGWEQFWKTPWFGVGMDNGRVVASVYTNGEFNAYLHNNYIELLCDGGIFGFIIYYSRYVYIIYAMIRNIDKKNDGYYPCIIMIIILLVMDYGRVSYYQRHTQVYFILLFMELNTIALNNNNKETNPIRLHEAGTRYLKEKDY